MVFPCPRSCSQQQNKKGQDRNSTINAIVCVAALAYGRHVWFVYSGGEKKGQAWANRDEDSGVGEILHAHFCHNTNASFHLVWTADLDVCSIFINRWAGQFGCV